MSIVKEITIGLYTKHNKSYYVDALFYHSFFKRYPILDLELEELEAVVVMENKADGGTNHHSDIKHVIVLFMFISLWFTGYRFYSYCLDLSIQHKPAGKLRGKFLF